MRKTKVQRDGDKLTFILIDSGNPIQLKLNWDLGAIESAYKKNQLYPAVQTQLYNLLRKRLEDLPQKLNKIEIDSFLSDAKKALNFKG